MNGSSITAGRGVLLGFISLYAALFSGPPAGEVAARVNSGDYPR